MSFKDKLMPPKKMVDPDKKVELEQGDLKAIILAASSIILPVVLLVVVVFGVFIYAFTNWIA